MSDLITAKMREQLAGLQQSFHGPERGLCSGLGELGLFGDLLGDLFVQRDGLDVADAAELPGGQGEGAGEDAFDLVLRVEIAGQVGIEGVEGLGRFAGQAHGAGEQERGSGAAEAVAGVVEAGPGLALGGDGATGFGAVGAGGGFLFGGSGSVGRHRDFILHTDFADAGVRSD